MALLERLRQWLGRSRRKSRTPEEKAALRDRQRQHEVWEKSHKRGGGGGMTT
jgi:hypothetical protein